MKYAEEYLNGVLQEKDSVYFDKNWNISTKEQLELEEQQEESDEQQKKDDELAEYYHKYAKKIRWY